jgi:putative sigma-54 modulation protein
MRLELTGRHVEITPALRRVVDRKLVKLDRLLNDSAVSAQIVLTREKQRHRADITLHARGERFLHGMGATARWDTALTEAIGKIAQQAQTIKGKRQERKRHGGAKDAALASFERSQGESALPVLAATREPARAPRIRMPRILRATRQTLKAMSLADAAREVDAGDDVLLIFRDIETLAVSVLYRRRNGELTLVETEA